MHQRTCRGLGIYPSNGKGTESQPCPPFQASGSSLGRKRSPRPGHTDGRNSWVHSVPSASTSGSSVRSRGLHRTSWILSQCWCLRQRIGAGLSLGMIQCVQVIRLSMEGPYATRVEVSPLTPCSRGLKSCCPSTGCSRDWSSYSPLLTSGLHSPYQAFTQDGKVLQDCFYIGHHHHLPTLRHRHAPLCVGGLWKSEKRSVSKTHPETPTHTLTPDTGSLMEQATHRPARPRGTICTHSGGYGCHQSSHLERVGLEAGGLPEDSNHLSTMLVIEEKGQVPIGLLRKSRTETR